MIHRSNLARSIANSMSAAKRIERDAIRFIMQVQIQEIHRSRILLNAPFSDSTSVFHRSLLLAAAAGGDSKLSAVKRKSISLSQR
jgi:hypothetical protein